MIRVIHAALKKCIFPLALRPKFGLHIGCRGTIQIFTRLLSGRYRLRHLPKRDEIKSFLFICTCLLTFSIGLQIKITIPTKNWLEVLTLKLSKIVKSKLLLDGFSSLKYHSNRTETRITLKIITFSNSLRFIRFHMKACMNPDLRNRKDNAAIWNTVHR